jgi:hypothetical protein
MQLMFRRAIEVTLLVVAIAHPAPLSSQKPVAPTGSAMTEFPVLLQQNVVAGKTPVGTKIQAKLAEATLLEGKVIPKNAMFSGEVVESIARTDTQPSLLSVRMDSVQWKGDSAFVKLYLTQWYYPAKDETGQNFQEVASPAAKRAQMGEIQYPTPEMKVHRPPPNEESSKSPSAPDTGLSSSSGRRMQMKNVVSVHNENGVIAITSSHSNLKLDKSTMYVLASGDLLAVKPAAAK